MKKSFIIWIIVILFPGCACVNNRCSPDKDINTLRELLMEEFIKCGWAKDIGDSIAVIKLRIGEPINETIDNVVNKYVDDQIDQIYKLTYDGFEIEIYHVNYETPYDLITDVVITNDNTMPLKYGIKLGDKKAIITNILGEPTGENGYFVYQMDSISTFPAVYFYFDNNLLNKVRWEWHPE